MDDALVAQLQALQRRDVETRERLQKAGRLHGRYDEDMQRVHVENARALAQIIALRGWPGIALVGLDGCRAAWLLAQHAICTPALQKQFLRELEKAADADDVPRKQVAMLTDRIRFHQGRPQVYGTVLDWNERGELGCELEDAGHVDARRATVGLPPFRQSLRQMREQVDADGGGPPADFTAYKAAADRWAKQVGWT